VPERISPRLEKENVDEASLASTLQDVPSWNKAAAIRKEERPLLHHYRRHRDSGARYRSSAKAASKRKLAPAAVEEVTKSPRMEAKSGSIEMETAQDGPLPDDVAGIALPCSSIC